MTQTFELCTSTDTKNLTMISDFVTSVAEELGLDEKVTFALQMAVDEACANVMEHAYGGRTNGTLRIALQPQGAELVVTIRDHGCPFDPEAVPRPDPASPLEKRGEGALGLYLIEQLMDSVEFQFDAAEGNTLTMKKRFHRGEQTVPSEC